MTTYIEKKKNYFLEGIYQLKNTSAPLPKYKQTANKQPKPKAT